MPDAYLIESGVDNLYILVPRQKTRSEALIHSYSRFVNKYVFPLFLTISFLLLVLRYFFEEEPFLYAGVFFFLSFKILFLLIVVDVLLSMIDQGSSKQIKQNLAIMVTYILFVPVVFFILNITKIALPLWARISIGLVSTFLMFLTFWSVNHTRKNLSDDYFVELLEPNDIAENYKERIEESLLLYGQNRFQKSTVNQRNFYEEVLKYTGNEKVLFANRLLSEHIGKNQFYTKIYQFLLFSSLLSTLILRAISDNDFSSLPVILFILTIFFFLFFYKQANKENECERFLSIFLNHYFEDGKSEDEQGKRFYEKIHLNPKDKKHFRFPSLAKGTRITGTIKEVNKRRVSFFLFDETNFHLFFDYKENKPLLSNNSSRKAINITIPRTGDWFLVLDTTGKQKKREIEIDLSFKKR